MNRSTSEVGHEKWLSLEIHALEKLRNIPRLLYLFEKNPASFVYHEGASLLVGRALLQSKTMSYFKRFRDSWESKEKQLDAWFVLDVDALIKAGNPDKAIKLLKSRSFQGSLDCPRLTRLALLEATQDLNKSWNLLEKAYFLDPRNTDVRLFRAQILEQIGKIASARVEYVAAYLTDPNNPLLRDQLAEFYRRNGNYGLAVETWAEGLSPPAMGFIWLKTLFWSRVAQPADIDWTAIVLPEGELKPYIAYLMNLPMGKFWDLEAYFKISRAQQLLKQRQEFFWLRLIEALRDKNESKAIDLIKTNKFRQYSWHTDLESALLIVLTYRKWGVLLNPEKDFPRRGKMAGSRHQFFETLDLLFKTKENGAKTVEVQEDIKNFFNSEEAFAAIFLAAGWVEATLRLHRLPIIPEYFPDWVAYGLTQAFRYNRGNKEAINFALKQNPSKAIDLLIAEIMLADGKIDESRERFTVLAKDDSDFGFRAAWMLSMIFIDQKQIGEAQKIIQKQPRLNNSLTGREIMAKIAVIEGNIDEAINRYKAIEKTSVEAKSYLAKHAFAQKDWKTARRLTEALMREFPDQLQLRANLSEIDKAESEK